MICPVAAIVFASLLLSPTMSTSAAVEARAAFHWGKLPPLSSLSYASTRDALHISSPTASAAAATATATAATSWIETTASRRRTAHASKAPALCAVQNDSGYIIDRRTSRRDFVSALLGGMTTGVVLGGFDYAAMAEESGGSGGGGVDVDSFLRSGMVSQPMGVSGQAGKSRPETGVVLRDGTEISRDARSGSVLAELVLESSAGGDAAGEPMAVLATFESPWPLAKGTVFDVECRDSKTGDGAFLAVTPPTSGKSISDLPDSFFLGRLFSSTGRFSFYGSPTDIKVKSSKTTLTDNGGRYRIMELSFSNLSQSTQTEIPRRAVLAATIPDGSDRAVMLIGSASASRWRKGSEEAVRKTVDSFRAVPAPTSGLKIRAKSRSGDLF